MYYIGAGIPRNFSEAARWFRAAADAGDPVAQHDLGVLYFKGLGVPLDYNAAAHWIALAAKLGNSSAAADLAYLYETGKGVPLDYVAAYLWYSRAIAIGGTAASPRLKSLSQIMTRKQLDEANTLVSSQSTQPGPSGAPSSPAALSLLPNP
jgi:TPR repeat protein